MTLKNNPNIIVVKRKKNAVIKNPYINVSEEEENYYYSLMLLYLPLRNENDLLGDNCDVTSKIMIHGFGGTGKSFLANVIVDTINLHHGNNESLVIVCAPTGVAAKNIGGVTCHSAFRLPIEKFTAGEFISLTGRLLQNMREKWKIIKWVIIDEISMVSYNQLRQIHLRLQQFKENENKFGGLNIILMGDFLQLKPCKNQPRVFEFKPQFLGEVDLWQDFNFYDLNINQRQKSDILYGDLCCRIRKGEQTAEDISLLNTRLLENIDNHKYFEDAVRLYSKKDDVKKYNDEKFQNMVNQNINPVFTLIAEDTYGEGSMMNKPINKNDLYSEGEKCGGIPSSCKLIIGCRVMLRRNIDVGKG